MEFSTFRDASEYNSFRNVPNWFELKNASRIREEDFSENPAELGIATGLLTTACIFNLAQITMLKEDFFSESFHLEHLRFKAVFHLLLNVICTCICSPVIVSSLVFLYAYRYVVNLLLGIQLGEKFVGLLEGTDSVWAIEGASCKSVVNVLAYLETASDADLLVKFRELAQDKLISSDRRLDKLSCLRKKKYGYFYWERRDNIDITEHVRWLDAVGTEGPTEEKFNDEYLNKILSKLCTQSLPQDDKASWEILVSRSHESSDCDNFKDMEEGLYSPGMRNVPIKGARVPIIFRVHHTLGDGFALFRLLLSTIADSRIVKITSGDKQQELLPPVSSRDDTERNSLTESKLCGSYPEILLQQNKDLVGASMPFSLMISADLKETVIRYVTKNLRKIDSLHKVCESIFQFASREIKESLRQLANVVTLKLCNIAWMMLVLIEMPSCLVRQALRSMDNSALHGPELTGEKIFSSWIEVDSVKKFGKKNLMTKIKQIKHVTGTRFGDVVLAALSASLRNYYKQIGEFAPQSLTVVLPARMSHSDENSRLDNGFSVGLLPLCISGCMGVQSTNTIESNEDPTTMERLFDVARNSHHLRGQTDYLINFWVMKWLSAVLPEVLLRPVLKSHSTLIFSNVPGPQEVHILGQRLSNIVFWPPHRGTTGVGFSVLSYGGNMHLGLIADKALIRKEYLLAEILKNTVKEIDNLHETIYMSHFAKSLHNSKTASTEHVSEGCERDWPPNS